jgi:RNA polymerase sigma-70 factor (ECF subfamily)
MLAQRVRADRSFERIYRRHVGDVYRYSLAVLRQPSDAENVTQTTFVNACRAFESGERPRNAQNWLITIAHDVCRRRSLQAAARGDEVGPPSWGLTEEEHQPTPDDIQRALGRLTFDLRAPLVMRELEGRSYAQIGQILGLPGSAVERLLFEARRALREQLEGSLTCTQAERAISRRADRRLPRAERRALRSHLRECRECARVAATERAQRNAFEALAAIPVPRSLMPPLSADGAGVGQEGAQRAARGRVEPSVAPVRSHVSLRQAPRPQTPGAGRPGPAPERP